MNFLTVSYFYWHILGNNDMCAQFLKERDLHITKITKKCAETLTIKELWRRVKKKYGIQSCRTTNLFEYQQHEEI